MSRCEKNNQRHRRTRPETMKIAATKSHEETLRLISSSCPLCGFVVDFPRRNQNETRH